MSASSITVRAAVPGDIGAMHRIRLSVHENVLSDPTRINEDSYPPYVQAGTAWVAEAHGQIIGFSAIDQTDGSVWALFVDSSAQGAGVGRALHDRMMQWSVDHAVRRLGLTTGPGTRAELFYRRLGWLETDRTNEGELRFERPVEPTQTPR